VRPEGPNAPGYQYLCRIKNRAREENAPGYQYLIKNKPKYKCLNTPKPRKNMKEIRKCSENCEYYGKFRLQQCGYKSHIPLPVEKEEICRYRLSVKESKLAG